MNGISQLSYFENGSLSICFSESQRAPSINSPNI